MKDIERIDLVGSVNGEKLKNRLYEPPSLSHHGYTNHVDRLNDSFDVPRGSPAPSVNLPVTSRAVHNGMNGVNGADLIVPSTTADHSAQQQQPAKDEVIEVQILPQDSWTDTLPHHTANGNMSDVSASFVDDLTAVTGSIGRRSSRRNHSFIDWQTGGSVAAGYGGEEYSGGGNGGDSRSWWQRRRSQFGPLVSLLVVVVAFLSPIAMLVAPRTQLLSPLLPASLAAAAAAANDDIDGWQLLGCADLECDGQLAALAFKLLVLGVGCWAVFGRQLSGDGTSLPRVHTERALLTALVLTVTLGYWLFLCVRVAETPPAPPASSAGRTPLVYVELVRFAGSLTDTLLWLHYLALLVLHLRRQRPLYVVHVLRSPDGVSRQFTVGRLSVQHAAAHVLRRYYAEFPVYNPYLEHMTSGAGGTTARKLARQPSSVSSYKYYDVDGRSDVTSNTQIGVRVIPGRLRRREDVGGGWKHQDQHEYERRVAKRRFRLMAAADDAFTHIRRMRDDYIDGEGVSGVMDPREAAQAIFPSMARALQKYLRVTRQQPLHTAESIVAHLALCLSHDVSPRAFLQRYLDPGCPLTATLTTPPAISGGPSGAVGGEAAVGKTRRRRPVCWSLVCGDRSVTASLTAGCVFQLRQLHVQLLCRVSQLPAVHLVEQLVDPRCNRFQLRLNSETSV